MKPKKFVKRLSLSKTTITNLGDNEKNALKGGYWDTAYYGGCGSWHPICFSMPARNCPASEGYPKCIVLTERVC